MIKFSEIKPVYKWITGAGAIITALAIIGNAISWAADTKYHTLVAQEIYVQKVSNDNIADDIRQLRRDIKRLELKDQAGNASPEDKAFVEYLKQDLEDLETQ